MRGLSIILTVIFIILPFQQTSGQTKPHPPSYISPYDISLGSETLPEKYTAVACKQMTTKNLEQCTITPDLSRKVDQMTIVRQKPSNKIYAVQTVKKTSSKNKAFRFARNEYARMLMSYRPQLSVSETVQDQDSEQWNSTEDGDSRTLVDEKHSVLVNFLVESNQSVISYLLNNSNSEPTMQSLLDHIKTPLNQ